VVVAMCSPLTYTKRIRSALRVPVEVLRAVVSTPSAPAVFVMRQEPRRHPSADVVVVAGAGGTDPVAVGGGDESVGLGGDAVLLDEPDVGAGVVAPVVGEVVRVGVADGVDDPPDRPQTAPMARPSMAASTSDTTTMAPAGMAPSAPDGRRITGSP
jgi:hypothetical protein